MLALGSPVARDGPVLPAHLSLPQQPSLHHPTLSHSSSCLPIRASPSIPSNAARAGSLGAALPCSSQLTPPQLASFHPPRVALQGFLAEGLQRTSAGLGSVIIDSQPLSVALLASLLFGERLGAAGVAGLFVGVAGLCLLEVPPSVLTSLPDWLLAAGGSGSAAADLAAAASAADAPAVAAAAAAAGSEGSWSLWESGEWWMLLAAQSMAVGTVMVRWVAKYCDPVVATGWHMVLGGVPLLALAAVQEGGDAMERLSLLTASDAVLLLYISLLGSAASYGVFFYNASRGNLTALSSLTFLTPMFAAAGGYLLLGETLTPLQLAGAGVTLGAVALINSNSEDGDSDAGEKGSSSSNGSRSNGSSGNGSSGNGSGSGAVGKL